MSGLEKMSKKIIRCETIFDCGMTMGIYCVNNKNIDV